MVSVQNQLEIVFFDLETTIPYREKDPYAILEFGSITLCPKKLTELGSYETLVRPFDMSLISRRSMDVNGITPEDVLSMPMFEEIADRVYNILHGRVWAGHDISRFDYVRLMEAFAQIKMPPPEPKGFIDTLISLTRKFGTRVRNMKLQSLAAYFGLGRQSHRSLGDVRMNFEVVKRCATVLFLEPSQPDTCPTAQDEKLAPSVDIMHSELVQSNEANMVSGINQPEIVFFDLETTIPVKKGQPYAILEFGSILLCPRKLTELESYEMLVRPFDMSLISATSINKNNITQYDVLSMLMFAEIADRVYNILHGRVWAGHDISRFDCERLREAYAQIDRTPPEPKRIIDTLALLTQNFGRRAGNMKMANLAAYFGLGRQSHRSLGDARMNLEVVKCCATVLFLESSQQDSFTESNGTSLNTVNGYHSNGDVTLEGSALNTSSFPSDRTMETPKFPTDHTAQDERMGPLQKKGRVATLNQMKQW
ncbi:NEN1-like protein [Tanacetum coccineum]|uniref:NEN1-like protein n=1 Tax=Tanacetum coccineum TaxID=301880 RepID=A0ABQ5AEE7_9ASTR